MRCRMCCRLYQTAAERLPDECWWMELLFALDDEYQRMQCDDIIECLLELQRSLQEKKK